MSKTRAEGNQSPFETELKPLWLQAQSGDEAAYTRALSKIAIRLRSFLHHRMLNSPDEVEDLVQETLLAIHLHRGTYDASLPISAWIIAIAKHKLIDFWRKHGRKNALNLSLDDVAESALSATASNDSSRLDFRRLLDTLPKAQSQAILLTKIEGLSIAETSRRTGASEPAIKVRVHRGLKRLAVLVRNL